MVLRYIQVSLAILSLVILLGCASAEQPPEKPAGASLESPFSVPTANPVLAATVTATSTAAGTSVRTEVAPTISDYNVSSYEKAPEGTYIPEEMEFIILDDGAYFLFRVGEHNYIVPRVMVEISSGSSKDAPLVSVGPQGLRAWANVTSQTNDYWNRKWNEMREYDFPTVSASFYQTPVNGIYNPEMMHLVVINHVAYLAFRVNGRNYIVPSKNTRVEYSDTKFTQISVSVYTYGPSATIFAPIDTHELWTAKLDDVREAEVRPVIGEPNVIAPHGYNVETPGCDSADPPVGVHYPDEAPDFVLVDNEVYLAFEVGGCTYEISNETVSLHIDYDTSDPIIEVKKNPVGPDIYVLVKLRGPEAQYDQWSNSLQEIEESRQLYVVVGDASSYENAPVGKFTPLDPEEIRVVVISGKAYIHFQTAGQNYIVLVERPEVRVTGGRQWGVEVFPRGSRDTAFSLEVPAEESIKGQEMMDVGMKINSGRMAVNGVQ